MRHLLRLGSLLVSCVAVVGLAGLASGCDKKAEGTAAASGTSATTTTGTNTVAITVDGDGFKPAKVTFKKGAPATMVFTRTSDETCATEVVFPELNIKKALPKGTPVSITIPTEKEQTLTFQCGMGMYKSSVVVAVN